MLSSSYLFSNEDIETLNNLSKITQQVEGRSEARLWVHLLTSTLCCPYCLLKASRQFRRQLSSLSSLCSFCLGHINATLLDCPGHADVSRATSSTSVFVSPFQTQPWSFLTFPVSAASRPCSLTGALPYAQAAGQLKGCLASAPSSTYSVSSHQTLGSTFLRRE